MQRLLRSLGPWLIAFALQAASAQAGSESLFDPNDLLVSYLTYLTPAELDELASVNSLWRDETQSDYIARTSGRGLRLVLNGKERWVLPDSLFNRRFRGWQLPAEDGPGQLRAPEPDQLGELWAEETWAAAERRTSPRYLPLIARGLGLALRGSLAWLEQGSESWDSDRWQAHAQTVLTMMSAFFHASLRSLREATSDLALNQPQRRDARGQRQKKAERQSLNESVWALSQKATLALCGKPAPSYTKVLQPAGAERAIASALYKQLASRRASSAAAYARVKYHFAEKVLGLTYLRAASGFETAEDAFFVRAYLQVDSRSLPPTTQLALLTPADWQAHATEAFRALPEDQRLFVEPWLREMVRIVAASYQAQNSVSEQVPST